MYWPESQYLQFHILYLPYQNETLANCVGMVLTLSFAIPKWNTESQYLLFDKIWHTTTTLSKCISRGHMVLYHLHKSYLHTIPVKKKGHMNDKIIGIGILQTNMDFLIRISIINQYFWLLSLTRVPSHTHNQQVNWIILGTLRDPLYLMIQIISIRNLEPNCQSSYSYSSIPRLLLAKIFSTQRFLRGTMASQNICLCFS